MVFYISGHLGEEIAKQMFKDFIIGNIEHKILPSYDVPRYDQMLKIPTHKVYQLNETQPNVRPVNPNSALLYNVYHGPFTYQSYVMIKVVMEVLQPLCLLSSELKRILATR